MLFSSVEVGEGSGSGLSLMTSEVWSDEKWLGSRAQFRPETFPAVLRVHEVAGSDAGQYRCRVDFREAPTRNTLVNLTVVGMFSMGADPLKCVFDRHTITFGIGCFGQCLGTVECREACLTVFNCTSGSNL